MRRCGRHLPPHNNKLSKGSQVLDDSAFSDEGPDGRVRYSAQDERIAAHVEMLSQAYRERPVTLFRMIYALRAGIVDKNLSRRRGL